MKVDITGNVMAPAACCLPRRQPQDAGPGVLAIAQAYGNPIALRPTGRFFKTVDHVDCKQTRRVTSVRSPSCTGGSVPAIASSSIRMV